MIVVIPSSTGNGICSKLTNEGIMSSTANSESQVVFKGNKFSLGERL
jgi:hypothetical protein